MAGLSWEWLEWSGEVQLWCSIFELGNGWRWCYSRVTGIGMTYVWCLEAFGSKRPRNARVKWKFEVLGQNMQQWWFVMQSWVLASFRACVFVGSLANSTSIYKGKVLRFEIIRNKESHVMSFWLVFEVILKNMVSMKGTCLVGWVAI